MSSRDLLFLLVSIGYFLGCLLLHHELPHHFENNEYRSDLGERGYTRVSIALALFGATMYFALGRACMLFNSYWVSVLAPAFWAIGILSLAIFVNIKMLRTRFVKKFISQWSPAAAEDGMIMKLILHQYNSERLILGTHGYAGYCIGETPKEGIGTLGHELSKHYPENMFMVYPGERVWIRLTELPLRRKQLLEAARSVPGFKFLELRFEEECLHLK